MATFEVKATLPYALRNPDCTATGPEELMQMAAECIEDLEEANRRLGRALERYESTGSTILNLVRELDVALNGDAAAPQASLCDIVAQVKDQRWKLVRNS